MKRTHLLIAACTVICGMCFSHTNAYAYSSDEAVEVIEEETPFSIEGNGEVLDDVTSDGTKQFITVTTKNNETFFLVIDRSSNANNVYMLSMIDESDLSAFLEEGEDEEEAKIVLPSTGTAEPVTEVSEEQVEVPQKNTGANTNWGFLLLIAGFIMACIIVGGYYVKIYKPKKEMEEDTMEGLEESEPQVEPIPLDDQEEPVEEEEILEEEPEEEEPVEEEPEEEPMEEEVYEEPVEEEVPQEQFITEEDFLDHAIGKTYPAKKKNKKNKNKNRWR